VLQTLKLCLVVMVLAASTFIRADSSLREKSEVVVEVYNDAQLAPGVLEDAESIAARIFGRAGIIVEFVTCGRATTANARLCTEPMAPTHFNLRVMTRPFRTSEDTFGMAFLGEDGAGRYGDVFLSSAERLRGEGKVSLAALLGHVMAHETGHLLLGLNAHTSRGIMRGRWEGEDLKRLGMGSLLFTPEQRQALQARVGLLLAAKSRVLVSKSAGGR